MTAYASDARVRELAAAFGSDQGDQDDRINTVDAKATDADAKAVAAQLPPYQPFASRAAAEATTIPPILTRISVGNLRYVADASGMALTTADGRKWSPDGRKTVDHYGSVGDFNADTANGYPTPAITRYDLPPQRINLRDIGVVASNLAADASNNVGAIQNVIDWLTSKTNGGVIHSETFDPRYTNPIITLNSPLVWKPKVSFDFDKATRFRATSAMTAMVNTGVGVSNRLTRVAMRGGVWDAGLLADSVFRLRDFQQVGISSFYLTRCSGNFIHLGDSAQSSANYELHTKDGLIYRDAAPFGALEPKGVYAEGLGCGDSWLSDLIIIGCKYGIDGTYYNTDFTRVHPWSNPPSDGAMHTGFKVGGGTCSFIQCYSDNPEVYGYDLSGTGTFNLIGSRTLRNDTVADNAGSCVNIGAGTKVIVTSGIFRGASALSRWANDFTGDLSGLTVRDLTRDYIVSTVGEFANGSATSGVYTPTATLTSNLDSVTPFAARWTRLGNIVTVSGLVSIDAAAAGQAVFELSLPVASNLTAGAQLTGNISASAAITQNTGGIMGSSATDKAVVNIVTDNTNNIFWSYSFSYSVL